MKDGKHKQSLLITASFNKLKKTRGIYNESIIFLESNRTLEISKTQLFVTQSILLKYCNVLHYTMV